MANLFGLAKDAFRRVFLRRELARTRQIVPPPVQNDDGRGLLGPPRAIETPARSAPTAQEKRDIKEVQETYTEVQLLGRDQGHDDGGIDAVMAKMRQVSSSNVWGYYFEVEGGYNQSVGKYRGAKSGLLYVTFLAEAPKGGQRPSSAGPTYVYFDVPVAKFEQFQAASESSAGRAVWDYLRVRGTSWQHQHRYRLAQVQGDYIPRKATRLGFKERQLLNPQANKIPNSTWSALSRLEHSGSAEIRKYANKMRQLLLQEQGLRRSTLPARSSLPNRGTPNRGRPNRGRP